MHLCWLITSLHVLFLDFLLKQTIIFGFLAFKKKELQMQHKMYLEKQRWRSHAVSFSSLQTGLPACLGLWLGPGQRFHLASEVVSCRRLGASQLWQSSKVFSNLIANTLWQYSEIKNTIHPQHPFLPRLGLLAVATSNGVVTIYSLPHPDALHANKQQANCGKATFFPAVF